MISGGVQQNGVAFLITHAKWAYKRLNSSAVESLDAPTSGNPDNGDEKGQERQIPDDQRGRTAGEHRWYMETFGERLYADLYGHLKGTHFFEELMAERARRAPERVKVIQSWQELFERCTHPLSPRELPWLCTALKAPDALTLRHTPAACTARVEHESLDCTGHFKRAGEAPGDTEAASVRRWSRTREDLTRAVFARCKALAAELSDEERSELLALYMDSAWYSAADVSDLEQKSKDILFAENALLRRAEGQLCELNHSINECDHQELLITDRATRFCALLAARALFEVLSRDRAVSTSAARGRLERTGDNQ